MELNSSELYLRKIGEALRNVIAPELQTPSARMAAAIVESCVQELLRRETDSVAVLVQRNARGAELAQAMRALLGACAGAIASASSVSAPGDASFNQASRANAAITAELSTLVRQLSQHGISATDPNAATLLQQAAQWEYDTHVELQCSGEQRSSANVAPAGESLTAEKLHVFLSSVHADGRNVQVENLRRAEGGTGKQTYFFTLRDAAGQVRELVVRKAEPFPLRSHGAYVIEREYHLLRAVAATGYPAPQPLWPGRNVPGIDGDFFVMERLQGEIVGTLLQGAAEIPEDYLLDVAEHLARLHAISLDTFRDYIERYDAPQLLAENVEQCYHRTIEEWREYSLHEAGEVHSPLLEYLFDWLKRHVPRNTRRPVLVHGDFNIHNVLCKDGRVSGVLDWESAMFGAAEQDLAYIRPHIARHIAWDKFVQRYLDAGGQPIDPATLDFYMTLSSTRVLDGLKSVTQKLQGGVIHDFRYCAVQLGYITQFMQLALEGIST